MKKILIVFILSTLPTSYIFASDQFHANSVYCSFGEKPLQQNLRERYSPQAISFNEEKMEIKVESKEGTVAQFTLTPVDQKGSFMASPLTPKVDPSNFFVKIDLKGQAIDLIVTDSFSSVCSGGMIVFHLVHADL